MGRAQTLQRVAELKDADQDFEWYPTTSEIIGVLACDLYKTVLDRNVYNQMSLLDVGAGDGRVLQGVRDCLTKLGARQRDGEYPLGMYAIEKSTIHLQNMPKEIVVLGTDFTEQTLIDKQVKAVFSNPPYSEFEDWTVKLIRETASKYLYLVIPTRWKGLSTIWAALKQRSAKVYRLGEFDFESADRSARAKVHLLRVRFRHDSKSPFDIAIEDLLPDLQEFERAAGLRPEGDAELRPCQISAGGNLIEALVHAYDQEVEQLLDAYRQVAKLNPKLLAELGVLRGNIMEGLRVKLTGLKDVYWRTLFDRLDDVTRRLASRQREEFLKSLTEKGTIDFTEPNILAMLIWISKWANDYFDSQLVELYRSLSELCNVVNYKSNQKVYEHGRYRYNAIREGEFEHYRLGHKHKLEYRLVVVHQGGIYTGEYGHEAHRGLDYCSHKFIQDCLTVANNLGFVCRSSTFDHDWVSNRQVKFYSTDRKPLLAVRAFKNRNIHLHFDSQLMLAINVEAGRLLGWLHSHEQAVEELQADKEEAEVIRRVFNSSFRIGQGNTLLRLT